MRTYPVAIALLSVVLAPFFASAGELSVHAIWKGDTARPPAALRVRVLDASPGASTTPALDEPITLGAPKRLQIKAGSWWLMVVGEDAWGEAKQLRVGDLEVATTIEVWPGGEIQGSLVMPPDRPLPAEIKTRFAPSPGFKGPKETLARCRVENEGKFRCKVPAQKLDVRFRADSYVSHHRWDLEVPRGGVAQAGALKLEPGASVVGWVVTEDGSPLTDHAKATLELAALATSISAEKTAREDLMSREVKVDGRGFIHFDGVPPGLYHLKVTQPPFGEASAEVNVFPEVEAELSAPLVLARPAELSAEILPPTDPWGEPWRAVLYRSDQRRGRGERVHELVAPADGFLKIPGLSRGSYVLNIVSSDNASWAVRRVAVGEEPMPLALTLSPVAVRGRVLLAGEPLAAKLWFGGRRAGVQVETESNDEGAYSAVLPRPGEWAVELEANSPRVKTTLGKLLVEPRAGQSGAELDLKLPDTRLKIRVVDETGEAIRRAIVSLDPQDVEAPPTPTQEWTDTQGTIELAGITPGTYFARAQAGPELEAPSVPFSVAEGYDSPVVTLTVRRLRKLVARVLTNGKPVPGARVLAVPAGALNAAVGMPLTDVAGEVELPLQPGVAVLDVTVEAPGLALKMARLPVPQDGALEVEMERLGGTLRLTAPVPQDQLAPHATLVHGGNTVHVGQFRFFSRGHDTAGVLGNEITLSEMEPGLYSLCPIPDQEPPAGKGGTCVSGVLQPGGVLDLVVPAGM